MINTYVYFNRNTFEFAYGYFTDAFESFIIGTDYSLLDKYDNKKEMITYDCNAFDMDGIPYYSRIIAIDIETATKYFNMLYPDDCLIEVVNFVPTGKPRM